MADPQKQNPLKPIFPPALSAGGRRGFFADALREAIGPISKLLDKKVNPLLRAIDELPQEIDALVGSVELDQPHVAPARRLPLPLAPEHILRPPGALAEGEFETTCLRCGKCVEVCPANAIKIDAGGVVAGGMPYIVPTSRPCVVCDELACMKHCPSGALKLVDKLRIRMGTAKVNQASCLRAHGEDCRLCVDACPVAAQAIYVSTETGKVRVKKSGCLGCGLCENVCPTEPRSIVVHPPRRDDVIIA